jgi:DNA-binding NtrC family response regulator
VTRPHGQRVLVVDDDPEMCWILKAILASVDCVVLTAQSAKDALAILDQHAFPLAFIDARLPDIDGLRLIETVKQLQPEIKIILISGYYFGDEEPIVDAIRSCRIHKFLMKPFRIGEIISATEILNG